MVLNVTAFVFLKHNRRGLVDNPVGLLDEKPGFEPQARHRNKIQKVFLRQFPLSRFLAKTLRVNKNCHEKVSQKSIAHGRLQIVAPAIDV